MIILNDTITVEASDIAQLSEPLQRDLAALAGRITPELYLSLSLNQSLKNARITGAARLVRAVLDAPAEKRDPALVLLQRVHDLVEAKAEVAQPAPDAEVAPEKKTVLGAIKSLFKK